MKKTGVSLSELMDKTQFSAKQLKYHLDQLMKKEYIDIIHYSQRYYLYDFAKWFFFERGVTNNHKREYR